MVVLSSVGRAGLIPNGCEKWVLEGVIFSKLVGGGKAFFVHSSSFITFPEKPSEI